MHNTALYIEIRDDLFQYIEKEVLKRKNSGDRGASKVSFIEELITNYKDLKTTKIKY